MQPPKMSVLIPYYALKVGPTKAEYETMKPDADPEILACFIGYLGKYIYHITNFSFRYGDPAYVYLNLYVRLEIHSKPTPSKDKEGNPIPGTQELDYQIEFIGDRLHASEMSQNGQPVWLVLRRQLATRIAEAIRKRWEDFPSETQHTEGLATQLFLRRAERYYGLNLSAGSLDSGEPFSVRQIRRSLQDNIEQVRDMQQLEESKALEELFAHKTPDLLMPRAFAPDEQFF